MQVKEVVYILVKRSQEGGRSPSHTEKEQGGVDGKRREGRKQQKWHWITVVCRHSEKINTRSMEWSQCNDEGAIFTMVD